MAMCIFRWGWAVWACALLSTACSSLPDWSLFGPFQSDSQETAAAGTYDFSWRLSGDRRAGPLQVFDDGRNTWLQFGLDQPVPAIFARSDQGDLLLAHRRQGSYVVLDGVWPLLVLRAGGLESQVQRLTPSGTAQTGSLPALQADSRGLGLPAAETVPQSSVAAVDSSLVAAPLREAAATPVAEALAAPVQATPVTTVEDIGEAVANGAEQRAGASPPAPALNVDLASGAQPPSALTPPRQTYRVSPDDGNLRRLLAQWAKVSGWTFEAEHWAVDVDIPIVGTAEFQLEFDAAVQQLLASTELSDRPLQPCFYANRVLRVVPYAQSCDRSAPLERA